VVFLLLSAYFVAGILYNKYKTEKTGTDVIPNKEFWSSLPGLIRDGCLFTKEKAFSKKGEYEEM